MPSKVHQKRGSSVGKANDSDDERYQFKIDDEYELEVDPALSVDKPGRERRKQILKNLSKQLRDGNGEVMLQKIDPHTLAGFIEVSPSIGPDGNNNNQSNAGVIPTLATLDTQLVFKCERWDQQSQFELEGGVNESIV